MTDNKIKAVHRQRAALVYIRQSTASQVEHNRESTARQYALAERACDLGWAKEQVMVIDLIFEPTIHFPVYDYTTTDEIF